MVVESAAGAVALKAASYIFAGCCLAIGFRMGNAMVNRIVATAVSNNPKILEKAKQDLEQIQQAIAEAAATSTEEEG